MALTAPTTLNLAQKYRVKFIHYTPSGLKNKMLCPTHTMHPHWNWFHTVHIYCCYSIWDIVGPEKMPLSPNTCKSLCISTHPCAGQTSAEFFFFIGLEQQLQLWKVLVCFSIYICTHAVAKACVWIREQWGSVFWHCIFHVKSENSLEQDCGLTYLIRNLSSLAAAVVGSATLWLLEHSSHRAGKQLHQADAK